MFLDQNIYISGLIKSKNEILGIDNYLNDWVIIIPNFENEALKEELMQFLNSILTAIGVDYSGVLVLNENFISNNHLGILSKYISFKYILSFGISSTKMGLKFHPPKYQFVEIGNYKFLEADTLEMIKNDVVLKKRLWNTLKENIEK